MRIPVDRLTAFVEAVAQAEGVPDDHAHIFATRMPAADLRGMHGHGLARLAPYVRRMRTGGYNLASKTAPSAKRPAAPSSTVTTAWGRSS